MNNFIDDEDILTPEEWVAVYQAIEEGKEYEAELRKEKLKNEKERKGN